MNSCPYLDDLFGFELVSSIRFYRAQDHPIPSRTSLRNIGMSSCSSFAPVMSKVWPYLRSRFVYRYETFCAGKPLFSSFENAFERPKPLRIARAMTLQSSQPPEETSISFSAPSAPSSPNSFDLSSPTPSGSNKYKNVQFHAVDHSGGPITSSSPMISS
jgi:hypothetical protein